MEASRSHEELQRVWLSQFLRALSAVAIAFAALLAGSAMASRNVRLWGGCFAVSLVLVAAIVGLRLARKGRLTWAASLVGYAIFVHNIVEAWLFPFSAVPLALAVVLAVVAVLPYLQGRALQALLAVSLACLAAVISIVVYFAPPVELPAALRDLLIISSTIGAGVLVMLLLWQFSDRLRRALQREHDARRRLAFLAEASVIFSSSLDQETTLQSIARLVVPMLGDQCVVDLVDAEGRVQRVAEAAVRPEDEALVHELRRYPPSPARPSPVFDVLRTGQTRYIPSFGDGQLKAFAPDDEYLRIVHALAPRSMVAVPIRGRHAVIGVMTFGMGYSGRHHAPADLELAEELGRRAGLAIENARFYQQAQEAIRLRDDFLSIASHELKTPLTPLQLKIHSLGQRASRLSDEQGNYEWLQKGLVTLHRQSERLNKLVSELLDISRITSGRLHLELEQLDIADVVAEVIRSLEGLDELHRSGCELRVEVPPGVVGRWDRLRLEQVVTNLLSNALKYGAGKPVELHVEQQGDMAILSVADQGIGIAAAEHQRIFRRFERAVSARHYGGLGLGLYIVQQIVDALGGSISVDSRPGQGARFTVKLPLGGPPQRAARDHEGLSPSLH